MLSSLAVMGCAVYIPALASLFSFAPLSLRHLGFCVGISALGALISSLSTFLIRRRRPAPKRKLSPRRGKA